MTDLRHDVVVRLVDGLRRCGDPEGMVEYLNADADATVDEKKLALVDIAVTETAAAVGDLEASGVLQVPAPTASVYDATMRQLSALADVWAVCHRWDSSLDPGRTLGSMVKTMPAEDVGAITRSLAFGGMLPD